MTRTHRRTALTFAALMIASIALPVMTTVTATGTADVEVESDRNDGSWGPSQYWAPVYVQVGDTVEFDINSTNLTTGDQYMVEYDLYDSLWNWLSGSTANWTAFSNNSAEWSNFTVPDSCELYMMATLAVEVSSNNTTSWYTESNSYFEWDVVDCTDPGTELSGQYDDGTWGPMLHNVFPSNITAGVGDTRMLFVNSSDLTQGGSYALYYAAYDCDWYNLWSSNNSIVSFTAMGPNDSRTVNVTMTDTCEVNFEANLYEMNMSSNSSIWLGGSDFAWQITNYTNPLTIISSNSSSGQIGDTVTAIIDSVNLTVGSDYELDVWVHDNDWNSLYSNSFPWTAMGNSSQEQVSITLPDSCWIEVEADLYENISSANGTYYMDHLDYYSFSWSVTDCSNPSVAVMGEHDNGTWGEMDWWHQNLSVTASVGDARMLEIEATGLATNSDFNIEVDVYDEYYNWFDGYSWNWTAASASYTEFINITMPNTCLVRVEAELYQTTANNTTNYRGYSDWEWEIDDCVDTGLTVIGVLNNGSWGEYDWWDQPEAYVGDTEMLKFETAGLMVNEDYRIEVDVFDDDYNSINSTYWQWTASSDSSTEFFNVTMPDTCTVRVEATLLYWDNESWSNWSWQDFGDWEWDVLDCTTAETGITIYGVIWDDSWGDLSEGTAPFSVGDVISISIETDGLENGVNYSIEIQLYGEDDLLDQSYVNWTADSSGNMATYNITVPDTCGMSLSAVLYADDGQGWYSYEDYASTYWGIVDCTRPEVIIEGEHANGSWGPMEWDQNTRINDWHVDDTVEYTVSISELEEGVNYSLQIDVEDQLGGGIYSTTHNFTGDSTAQAGPYDINFTMPDTCHINVQATLYEVEDGWNSHIANAHWSMGVRDCTRPDISLTGATGTAAMDGLDWDEEAMMNEQWSFEMRVSNLIPGDYVHRIQVHDMWGDVVHEESVNDTRTATERDDVTSVQTSFTFGSDCRYRIEAIVYSVIQNDWGEEELRHYSGHEAEFYIIDCSRPNMGIYGEHANGSWGPDDDDSNITAMVGDDVTVDVEIGDLAIGTIYQLEYSWWNGTLWDGSDFGHGDYQWNATSSNHTFFLNATVPDSCELDVSVRLMQIRTDERGWEQGAELEDGEFHWDITDASGNCPPTDEAFATNLHIGLDAQQNADNITAVVVLNYSLRYWFRMLFDQNSDGTFNQTEADSFLAEINEEGEIEIPIELYLDGVALGEPDSYEQTAHLINGVGDWDDGQDWNLVITVHAVFNQSGNTRIEVVFFERGDMDEEDEIDSFSFSVTLSSVNSAMIITSVDVDGTALSFTNSSASGTFTHDEMGPVTVIFEDPNAIADEDADGVADEDDLCPGSPAGSMVDLDGCAPSQLDSDGDGVMDDADQCMNTPSTDIDIDTSGCGESQRDSDGDGVMDNADNCPNTPATALNVDASGCSADDDGDGWTNAQEADCGSNSSIATSVPEDFDGDGLCDLIDNDDDDDDWTDTEETDCGSDPVNASAYPLDSDGDGICDAVDLTPYPSQNMLPTCSVAYSLSSTISFMGTSIETRMNGASTMSTPLSGSFDIDLPVGSYMIFIECSDPDGDDMTVTITAGSSASNTVPLGDSFYAELNFTLTETMVGSGQDISLQWTDGTASGEISMDISVIAPDQPIDITPEDVEEGGLPGFTAMLGVLSLLGAAIIQRRRT